uniref:Exportin-5 n=1 Tax=Timema cristinae TaxID=61476 RepID=A0A7R9CIE3_TIMCR|nr:unnamed protein product [Timema cristinae]
MEVSTEVVRVAAELSRAIELTMDPCVPQERRMEAYIACDRFKDTSPLCAQCGLYLAQRTGNSHFVRHFGLQLMEHCVKYRWNQISQPEKLFIKENAMKLLAAGAELGLQEHNHIKDALSRVIVEMVKREWPQQWSTLLSELSDACTCGETQTEMVLLIFLRLVEDVALLQTLESNLRRKDIYQALTTNMSEIFTFILRIIEEHCRQFQALSSQMNHPAMAAHARVVQVALLTLTGFVEWVSISHIMSNDGRLLHVLCLLLADPHFNSSAAECLLQIVNRKGRLEDRRPLMILFSADAIKYMFEAAGTSSDKILDEPHYFFLKKLTQVLTGLGSQLCSLWAKEDGCPPNFAIYLEAMLTFTSHPSLTLAHYANTLWLSFFKHDLISKDPTFLSFVPKWVQSTAPKIVKASYPTIRCSGSPETVAYACMDYDSDDEYAAFFHRCRTEFLDTFRCATIVAPLVTFQYVEDWLTRRVTLSMIATTKIECSLQSCTFLEWEGLSQVLESVMSRILVCCERPSVGSGLILLELCLNYQPIDPLLLSVLLSCISSLFVFVSMATADISSVMLPRVLEKIFAALVFSLPGQTKDTRSRAVKNVRRHAASLMVKIGQRYPLLLLPMFDRINATVQGLNQDPGQLSKMERVTLQEALILISNHFCDYERQTKFVGEVIAPGAQQWVLLAQEAFKGPKEFMAFVGLDRPPVEPSTEDLNGQNRAHIIFCVDLFMAAVKRCAWPEDPDRAAHGGFIVGRTEAGNPVCRNPAAPHIIPLLPQLLALLKIFNQLWTPEALSGLSEGYRTAHNMLEVDKNNLLGIGNLSPIDVLDLTKPKAQTPQDRMQHFLSMVHDFCYHILGNTGPSFGRDLYQLQGLAPGLVASVFDNLEVIFSYIPDYRLRPIVRVFLKPFICSCPPAFYETVILPVLTHFFPYMFVRLSSKWQYITQLYDSGGIDDEQADTQIVSCCQEVLEATLTRTLTREYMDVMKVALIGGASSGELDRAADMDQDMDRTETSRSSLQSEVISELGSLLLRSEATCQAILLCLLRISKCLQCVFELYSIVLLTNNYTTTNAMFYSRALSWHDTIASLKATFLVAPVVRHLFSDHSLTPQVAAHIMTCVLQGLALHGQHEANQGSLLVLGVQMYEILRPKFINILEVMNQIPNCSPQDIQKLDDKILMSTCKTHNKVDKNKKEIFKRLTNQLVGRSVGQLFRKEVQIADLPRLELPNKQKPPKEENTSGQDIGLCRLFKT